MQIGVDYSDQSANWASFARSLLDTGRSFVGRYLPYDLSRSSPSKDPRVLTVQEAEILASFGIDIFMWWEDSPTHRRVDTENRATDGRSAGIEDAILAHAMMQHFGQPEAPIFFTVDTDTDISQIAPYFEGAKAVVGYDRMGAYGGYFVIKGLFDKGLIKYACQTEAWSRFDSNWNMVSTGNPIWDPRAQLRQWVKTYPGYAGWIGGIECDGLDAVASDFGQWRYGREYAEMNDIERQKLDKIAESTAKQSYTTPISNALDPAVKNYPEAKRLNDEFYKRWPYPQNTTGLPVNWEPPK